MENNNASTPLYEQNNLLNSFPLIVRALSMDHEHDHENLHASNEENFQDNSSRAFVTTIPNFSNINPIDDPILPNNFQWIDYNSLTPEEQNLVNSERLNYILSNLVEFFGLTEDD